MITTTRDLQMEETLTEASAKSLPTSDRRAKEELVNCEGSNDDGDEEEEDDDDDEEEGEEDEDVMKFKHTSDDDPEERVKARRRYCLLVFAFLYTFFFSGAFFGWGPMQLLLEENGSFSSKCTEEEQRNEEVCPSQSAALVRIHFVAIMTQFVSPFLGELVDRYGPAFLSYLMATCGCLGLMLFILAAKMPDKEWILYAALITIANSTWMGGLLTVRTGMVFQGRARSRVIFITNAMFDAGSITYLGLRGLAQTFDWTLTAVACFYLGMAVICFGGAAYFWTIVEPENEISTKLDRTTEQDLGESDQNPTFETKKDSQVSIETPRNHTIENASVEENDKTSTGIESRYVLVAERTQIQQILSGPFLLTLFYATFMITANQWTLTTTRAFLGYLGDDKVDNRYLTIFTLLFPASLAALPFTDAITAKYGFHGGFQAVNVLAIGYSLIRLLSDDLNVQIIGFILFSFFRSFLFGITFSAVPVFLSPDVVGKAMGLTYAVAGLVSFVNIPLSRFAIEEKDGDLFIPNLFYTCLIGPCIIASWMLANAIDKESKIKEKRKTQLS